MNLFSSLILLLSLTHLEAKPKRKGKIFNGYSVEPPFKYPWMVAIFRYGAYWCGGVLLSENVVLTAAHCAVGDKAPLRNFQVHLHRHDLEKDPQEESGLVFPVIERYMNPGYNSDLLYNDLAVFILDTTGKADTNYASTIIELDNQLTHEPGMRSTVLGWGRITPSTAPYPILQEVVLPIYNDQQCINDIAVNHNNYIINPDIQICAGLLNGGQDACGNDSGGPLFTYVDDKPVIIGIVSNGPKICGTPRYPGIYTRVAIFRDWILTIINQHQQQSIINI